MTEGHRTARYLYGKLLTFYPRAFRERMAESMEQTFADLCHERKQTSKGFAGFILWVFAETGLGIIREQVFVGSRRIITMKTTAKSLALATIIGFALMLPLAILDVVNNPATRQIRDFFPLMSVFWFLAAAFVFISIPIIRTVRAGDSLIAKPFALALRVGCLALLATVWSWGFIDQLPCFLGVPNCD